MKKAPEPDAVVWENLEVNYYEVRARRALTGFVSFILLLVAFAIICQASIRKKEFASKVPPLAQCRTVLPEVYGLFTNATTESNLPIFAKNTYVWARPPSLIKATLDGKCSAVSPTAIYAVLTNSTFENPIGGSQRYSVSACSKSLCPLPGAKQQCPCIDITTGPCYSAQCYQYPDFKLNAECKKFDQSLMSSCFCFSELQTYLRAKSFKDAFKTIDNICKPFLENYSLGETIPYAMTFVTVVVNYLLVLAINSLNFFEVTRISSLVTSTISPLLALTNRISSHHLIPSACNHRRTTRWIASWRRWLKRASWPNTSTPHL